MVSLSEDEIKTSSSPDYVRINNMGYVFLTDSTVKLTRHLGDYGDSDMEFAQVWIDHGEQPQDEAYAYVILPDSDGLAAARYSKYQNTRIIENSNKMHAVRNITQNKYAANIFEDSVLRGVGFQAPCSVIMTVENKIYDIYISDPTLENGRTIEITFPTEKCEVLSSDAPYTLDGAVLTADVSKTPGASYNIKVRIK